jgi:hypothetical protein
VARDVTPIVHTMGIEIILIDYSGTLQVIKFKEGISKWKYASMAYNIGLISIEEHRHIFHNLKEIRV